MTWSEEWGFPWGGSAGGGFQLWFVDGLAQVLDTDQSFSVDGLALLPNVDKDWFVDGIALATLNATWFVDSFTSRLGLPGLADTENAPIVLVELEFPSGTIRVAKRDITLAGTFWSGRLIQAGVVRRRLVERQDSARVVIEDTATNGPVISALFTDATPPEGAKVKVEFLSPASESASGESSPTLYDQLAPLVGAAKGLPSDLAKNHDHYLHGQPKR